MREIRERQGHVGPTFQKEVTMQYDQSPWGIIHNHPSCQHTPLNMHSLMQNIESNK